METREQRYALNTLTIMRDNAHKTALDYSKQGDRYGAAWYCSRELALTQALELLAEVAS